MKNWIEKRSDARSETIVMMNTMNVASWILIFPEAIGRNRFTGCFRSNGKSMMSLRTYEVDERRHKIQNAQKLAQKCSALKSSPEKMMAVKTTKFLIH